MLDYAGIHQETWGGQASIKSVDLLISLYNLFVKCPLERITRLGFRCKSISQ